VRYDGILRGQAENNNRGINAITDVTNKVGRYLNFGAVDKETVGNWIEGGSIIFGAMVGKGKPSALGDKTVTFGRNANSEYHTIRHVRDELNLNPNEVRSAILNDIPSNLSYGANNGLKIEVGGVKLEYNVFKFPDGTYNVGRITGETKK
jgi:hypothetical protein